MLITYKKNPDDPAYPIMVGKTPICKEFNKRQEKLWKNGTFETFDYEQVTTILLEILCDDYDKRHASRRRKPQKDPGKSK